MNKNLKLLLRTFKLLNLKVKNSLLVQLTALLLGHTMHFDPAYSKFNFLPYKVTNLKYAALLLQWYLSQNLDCLMVSLVASIWKHCCDLYGQVNSNYGYLIFNKLNYLQYRNTLELLISHKESRRAIMIYNRPKMHYDYCDNGKNDFICTMYNMFMIRNNKLYSIYNMRSNDVIYGLFNDYYWANYVYHKLYNDLLTSYPDLLMGLIIWQACSLHLYKRHFKLVKNIIDKYGKLAE